MRFDICCALTRDIGDRRRELFENRRGLVESVCASTRNLVLVRGHAMQQPPVSGCYLAAIRPQLGFTSLDQVFDKRFLRHRICTSEQSDCNNQ
jgi:hypothetical protein